VPGPSPPVPFGTERRRLGRDCRLERCSIRWRETKDGLCQNLLPQVSIKVQILNITTFDYPTPSQMEHKNFIYLLLAFSDHLLPFWMSAPVP